jgi:hypothetical protein
VALSQIKKTGESGRGLAIANLVLSGLWVLVFTLFVVAAVASSAPRNDAGQITAGGTMSATSLIPGDCVNGVRDTTSLFDLPAGPFPGQDAINTQATSQRNAQLSAYSPPSVILPAHAEKCHSCRRT